MFSARKLLEPPSKRGNGLPLELSAAKRQRLELWGETQAVAASASSRRAPPQRLQSLDDIQNDNVLVATPECVVTRVRGVPAAVADEIRRERPSARQVVNCRVAVPSVAGPGVAAPRRGERQVLSYYVLALRQRVVLWQEGSGSVVTLSLPDEIGYEEPLHPFLFALYGARISLMIVSRSGRVLFWEDVDLPYESVPLSVQIPLQPHEQVFTNAHASLTVSPSTELDSNGGELKSILCWSNIGSVWEVAMEDRRIRVRALERQQGGFLSGLTKTVSQFFFSSAAATSASPDVDVRIPIKAVKIVPMSRSFDGRDADDEGRVEKLLLFHSGLLERRSFNSADALDCTSSTVWHFDANRAAISYFSEQFSDSHLAKVFMLSIPYVHEDSSFGVVVAYVCTARNEDTPKVKYALLQFKSSSPNAVPEPQWACVLDYEPVFSETVNSNEFFDVETISINSSAFYLVWIHSQPIHFASIQLPSPGQTSVRFQGFSLQGVERNSTLGFAPRLEVSSEASDALRGSVSFILSDYEAQSASSGFVLCSATASNMARLHNKTQEESSRRTKRVEDSDELTPESLSLGENLSVEEYALLLAVHAHDEHKASTGPLRISSGDVPNVAQAVIGVAYQILDAKASSGLRWGKDTNDSHDHDKHFRGATVTPKLVRFQLEEKRARFEEFISFIQQRCSNVWHHMESSAELLQYLIDGEEQLHAAVSLCKFQGSVAVADDDNSEAGLQPKLSGKLLLRAIERAVHQRGYEKEQLRLAGYNAFDIFYCEVSKISEIFVALSVEVQRLASDSGEGNTDFLYALLESGYSMQSLLKTPTATRLESNGNWMFTRPIREVIADQISRLSNAVGYAPVPSGKSLVATPDEVFEIANQISKLGGILLNAYQRFIPTTSGEIEDDLRKEADITKRLTLNPLVYVATAFEPPLVFSPEMDEDGSHWTVQKKSDLFEACVKVSEQYTYYEAMVFLAYREDEENLAKLDYILGRLEKSAASKRLESYCRKVPDFAEFVFRWYGGEAVRYPWGFDGEAARAQMFSYLLSNSSVFGPTLHSYLKAHPTLSKFAWVTASATDKYDHVAHLSLKDALNERSSLSKRKTMASIAKIAALAGPATPVATATEIKRELNIGRIQEVLMELPVSVAIDARPLSPEELTSKALQALQSVAPEDPLRASVFLVAVEALECLPGDMPRSDFDKFCISAWRECVLADTDLWAQLLDENDGAVNEHKVESMMRSTLLFKVMSRYVAGWRERQVSRPAGLTVDMVDDMVSREVSGSAGDAVINVRSRQLFVKTLHLAQKL